MKTLSLKKKQIQLEKNESGRERNKTLNEEDDNSFQKKESGPLKELERSGLKREALQKEDSEKRERESSGLDLNKQRETRSHTSQVDKIDTFYRSGESSKKKEHSWDNLTDKNDQLELGPGKNRKSDLNGKGNGDGKNLGEVTIDYRKLKEEFEMMAMGQSGEEAHHSRTNTDSKLKNDDDDGSFKVIETEAMGVDFSIAIINLIYSKEVKSKQIFSLISDELITNYHCYPIFYQYKTSAKSFNETFNSFSEITGEKNATL